MEPIPDHSALDGAMSPIAILILLLAMVGTSFLSGIFGMAGGLILIGILLALMPLPDAMMLHGVTQLASNGWRGLLWWRHIRWRAMAFYVAGCLVGLAVWSLWRYVPDKAVALLLLGVTPFLVRLAPEGLKADPENPIQGVIYGAACMSLILLTGVAGPLIDTYFLGGKLDRREIVATKSACQVFGHTAKLAYFGGIIEQTGSVDPLVAVLAIVASMVGTTLAARVLEAMTDKQFRSWANAIITVIACYYVAHGMVLLVV
jgi:uncharacterized membrane protein YfcA